MIIRLITTALVLSMAASGRAQSDTVHWVGSMYATNKLGEMQAKIDLDTTVHNHHCYGIGPMANMGGEITLVDDIIYLNEYIAPGLFNNHVSAQASAPFFVYTHQALWDTLPLPAGRYDIDSLEQYLNELFAISDKPFVFRLIGKADSAEVHVVHIKDHEPIAPESVERIYIHWTDQELEAIGFFSRHHQRIFTHHDSFIHVHAIKQDGSASGHVDRLYFKGDSVLLLIGRLR